jgi:hypothetical protein
MKISRNLLVLPAIAATCLDASALTLLHSLTDGQTHHRDGSSEILAYTADMHTVLNTVGDNTGGSFGVQVLTMAANATLSERGFIDLGSTFGAASNWNGVSSVAADPLGRGWGAAALIPSASTTTAGKVTLFDYRNPAALVTLDVGFHPDSVKFSADGTRLFVVNEGEFNAASGVNAPGSISIIDLTGVNTLADVNGTNITAADVSTFDFSSGNLASGVSLNGIRNPSIGAVGTSGTFIANVPDFNTLAGSDPDFFKGMEPEFVTELGGKLYVTMQENNAVGVFDLATSKWSAIHNLGTIRQVIDASDQDGTGGTASPQINDLVTGLPMPDSIAAFTAAGTKYFITANEGDARGDDRDVSRFGDIAGNDSMNNIIDTNSPSNYPLTQTGDRANSVLGRLNVSRLDGDTDGDGKIDTPTMIGTRSFSIWNADTGALVWDSGSGNGNRLDTTANPLTNIESLMLALDPAFHNTNNAVAASTDTRSDDKGPEPEGMTIGQFGSDMLAFIGLERQNGIMVFNISDPTAPFFAGLYRGSDNAANALMSPESLLYVSALDSPTGQALLLGGFELNNGGIGIYGVPEPSRVVLGLMGLALLVLRRRR